jgi:hypothetical protein
MGFLQIQFAIVDPLEDYRVCFALKKRGSNQPYFVDQTISQ